MYVIKYKANKGNVVVVVFANFSCGIEVLGIPQCPPL